MCIRDSVFYHDDDVVAFADIAPMAPTHILVVPRRHITDLNEVTSADETLAARLLLVAKQVAHAAGVAENGYRVVINCGPDGGQTVPHLHLHVLGGRVLDTCLG